MVERVHVTVEYFVLRTLHTPRVQPFPHDSNPTTASTHNTQSHVITHAHQSRTSGKKDRPELVVARENLPKPHVDHHSSRREIANQRLNRYHCQPLQCNHHLTSSRASWFLCVYHYHQSQKRTNNLPSIASTLHGFIQSFTHFLKEQKRSNKHGDYGQIFLAHEQQQQSDAQGSPRQSQWLACPASFSRGLG